MQQVGPGFQHVGEVVRPVVAEHPAEFVAPADADHLARFVKVHVPFSGAEHLVDGVERGRFVLQCGVQGVVFLHLGDVDGHAPALHRPAFVVPREYAHDAEPTDRAVLPAEAEIVALFAQNVFVKNAGVYMAEHGFPVFGVNAPHEGFQFIWKIVPVGIADQPAQAVAPLHGRRSAVRRKVDGPASRLGQVGEEAVRLGQFLYGAAVHFIVCRVHKGLPYQVLFDMIPYLRGLFYPPIIKKHPAGAPVQCSHFYRLYTAK